MLISATAAPSAEWKRSAAPKRLIRTSACVGLRPLAPVSSAMASSRAVTRQPACLRRARTASKAARSFLAQRRQPLQHVRREGRARIGPPPFRPDRPAGRGSPRRHRSQRLSGSRTSSHNSRSFRALREVAGAAGQEVVEVHAARRARDAHAVAVSCPVPGTLPRRCFAGIVRHRPARSPRGMCGEDRGLAGRWSKGPPRPRGPLPAWRRGRSRCLRRP